MRCVSMLCLPALVLALAFGCGKGKGFEARPAPDPAAARVRRDAEEFLAGWLREHGQRDVVMDANGVGVKGNPLRMTASLYGAEAAKNGSWTVETEFDVQLDPDRRIVEYVVGVGGAKDAAINDSLMNITLSTLHVIYKAFINPSDPHTEMKQITVDGRTRQLITGDALIRTSQGDKAPDMTTITSQIGKTVSARQLAPGPHWLKVVYARVKQEDVTCSVSLDNKEDEQLTEAVKGLTWPSADKMYMVKEFIVIK